MVGTLRRSRVRVTVGFNIHFWLTTLTESIQVWIYGDFLLPGDFYRMMLYKPTPYPGLIPHSLFLTYFLSSSLPST
jgi:hypothetical protein